MNLTPEQQASLDDAANEYGQLLAARVEAKAVGRRAELAHIADQQLRWEMAAARYAATGAPKSQLRLLTTKNPKTVDNAIASGARFVKAEPKEVVITQPENTRFRRIDDDKILVTLQPAEFEPYAHGLPDGVPTEAQDWTFSTDGGTLAPEHADDDETWMHPVVKVVMNTPMKAEVLAFIEQARG